MGASSALTSFFRIDELTEAELATTVTITEQEQPEHARRFLARVTEADGPSEQLDMSIASLRTAWTWFAATQQPEPGPRPSDPSGLALWMRGLAGRVEVVGYDYAWAATELAGYFAETLRNRAAIRFMLQDHNKWPVLVGPTGAETGHFPKEFAAAYKPGRRADADFLLRKALRLAGGTHGIPEPLYEIERFGDEVAVTFPDEVANRHFETVLEVERRALDIFDVELVEGDRNHLAFRYARPTHQQLWLQVTLALEAITDPRFETGNSSR